MCASQNETILFSSCVPSECECAHHGTFQLYIFFIKKDEKENFFEKSETRGANERQWLGTHRTHKKNKRILRKRKKKYSKERQKWKYQKAMEENWEILLCIRLLCWLRLCYAVWMGILLLKRKPKKNDGKERLPHRVRSIHSLSRWRCRRRRRRRHWTQKNEKNRLRIGFVMLSDCACKNQSHKATPLKTQYNMPRSYAIRILSLCHQTNLTQFLIGCMCVRVNGVCPLFSVAGKYFSVRAMKRSRWCMYTCVCVCDCAASSLSPGVGSSGYRCTHSDTIAPTDTLLVRGAPVWLWIKSMCHGVLVYVFAHKHISIQYENISLTQSVHISQPGIFAVRRIHTHISIWHERRAWVISILCVIQFYCTLWTAPSILFHQTHKHIGDWSETAIAWVPAGLMYHFVPKRAHIIRRVECHVIDLSLCASQSTVSIQQLVLWILHGNAPAPCTMSRMIFSCTS